MQSIRAWFKANPHRIDEILQQNRSYIFFREAPVDDPALGPIAAAKVPLTPGRSIAVDRLLHTFGTPFFIDAPTLTAFGGKAVPAADDRAGHRLGDHRPGARRPLRRIGRCGRRNRRRRAQRGRFLCAAAEAAGRERRADEPATAKKLSDEDRVLWNLVARSAKPLKGESRRRMMRPSPPPVMPNRLPPRSRLPLVHRRRPPQAPAGRACARPADARQAVQGPAADRRPRRPARHDPERGAFAAAVLPAAGACRRRPLCAGDHRQGFVVGRRRRSCGARCRPGWRRRRSARWSRAMIIAARQHGGAGALYVRLRQAGGK